ncbi:MAG: outer membrane beta-barrel protein [Rhizobacter sp.]|nr:outer membrane beta-barrel protein [Chlorobiales bacterium]
MKKILFVLLLLSSTPAFAQRYPPPRDIDALPYRDQFSLWLGPTAGGSFGTSNFSGYNGWNYGGRIRFELPRSPINFIADISYNPMVARTSPDVFIGRYLTVVVPGEEYWTSILSIGGGIEFTFPRVFTTPYLSLDFAYYAIKPDGFEQINRQGIGIGLGTVFSRPDAPIGFGLEAKYRFSNLFGGESGEGNINYFQLTFSLMFRAI